MDIAIFIIIVVVILRGTRRGERGWGGGGRKRRKSGARFSRSNNAERRHWLKPNVDLLVVRACLHERRQ